MILPNLPPLNFTARSEAKSTASDNFYSFGSGWTVTTSSQAASNGASSMPGSLSTWLILGAAALVAVYLVKK